MKNTFKTLYISPNGYLGGAEKAMIHFCYGHRLNGWPCEILFFQYGPAVDYAREYGITCHLLPHSFKLSEPLNLVKSVFYIRKFIQRNQFKIVHATMAYGQIVAGLSTLFLSVKKMWYQHGPVGGKLDQLASLFPVDQIYFNSNYLLELHNQKSYLAIEKEREFVVPIGIEYKDVNENDVQQIRKQYAEPDTLLFLLAGRICSWKGYETAINALISFQDHPWHLLIIGSALRESDQAYEKRIQQLVIDLNLTERVTFLPFQKNIYDYFYAADIFFHTSTVPEPFGLVVAEAMLQQALVIGSSQGGITDILIDKETGFTFDSTSPHAVEELTKQLEIVLDLPLRRKQDLQQKSKTFILKRHEITSCAGRLERLYQR